MICRLDCPGIRWRALPHLVVLHGYFLSLRPVGQLRRQVALRSYSRWCCITSGFGILTRRIWSGLNICRKIQWLFWFSQLQGPFTSSLSTLNWCYVNKNWYTSLNFQGCILCWAIRNKKRSTCKHWRFWSFFFTKRDYLFQMFFVTVRTPRRFLIFGYIW